MLNINYSYSYIRNLRTLFFVHIFVRKGVRRFTNKFILMLQLAKLCPDNESFVQ